MTSSSARATKTCTYVYVGLDDFNHARTYYGSSVDAFDRISKAEPVIYVKRPTSETPLGTSNLLRTSSRFWKRF